MSWIQVTKVNGDIWEVPAASICGQTFSIVKEQPVITLLLGGNVTLQVRDETLETIRRKVYRATGRSISVATDGKPD